MKIKSGIGYDVHPLAGGHEFWLGGILIPSEKGAVGHSDADTLIHAICDALLGAAGLGDIGTRFPDSDPAYKDIDSKLLLSETADLIRKEGYTISNVDATVCLERPKISGYIPRMKETLCPILGIDGTDLSIKATTTEKLGFTGREEGVAAYAVTILVK